MARLAPYFLKSHGRPRVDDRRVLSGIVFVNRNGLRWRDAPKDHGPHKPVLSLSKRRCITGRVRPDDGRAVLRRRRSQDGDDRRDLSEGAPHGIRPDGKRGDVGCLIGRTKGGMNIKALLGSMLLPMRTAAL